MAVGRVGGWAAGWPVARWPHGRSEVWESGPSCRVRDAGPYRGGVYRFLLTPRWWGINVFAALSIPVCLFMGSWQLSRFESRVDTHREQQDHAVEAETAAAAPLAELLPVTKETSGRQARAIGRYDAGRQMLVPDRSLDDREGFYVLTLLRIDGDRAAVPVVRGWLPGDADSAADRAQVPAPPAGEVTVVGALQASEHSTSDGVNARGGLPKGQLGMISAASLVNLVPYDVHDAWITVTKTTGPLKAVPPAAAEGTGLDLKAFQNLGYTGEWFVFAGFVLFMWFRLFRREVENARDVALGITPPSSGSGSPDPGGSGSGGPGGSGGAGSGGLGAGPSGASHGPGDGPASVPAPDAPEAAVSAPDADRTPKPAPRQAPEAASETEAPETAGAARVAAAPRG